MFYFTAGFHSLSYISRYLLPTSSLPHTFFSLLCNQIYIVCIVLGVVEDNSDIESSWQKPVDGKPSISETGSVKNENDNVSQQSLEMSPEKSKPVMVKAEIQPMISMSDVDLRTPLQQPLCGELFNLGETYKMHASQLSVKTEGEKEPNKVSEGEEIVQEVVESDKDISSTLEECAEQSGRIKCSETPEGNIKEEICFEDDAASDNTSLIKEKQELIQTDNIVIPPPPNISDKENESQKLPTLLPPPPYPNEILKLEDVDQAPPVSLPPVSVPVLPDPPSIGSQDVDLRRGQIPMAGMTSLQPLLPMNVDVETQKCLPMEYPDKLPETKQRINPPDYKVEAMEVDQYVPRITSNSDSRSHGLDSRSIVSNAEPPRPYHPSKKYPQNPEGENDSHRGTDSPTSTTDVGMPATSVPGPWDSTSTSQASTQNIPPSNISGPGMGPWTRQLLRPPPAMMIQNQFVCWPNPPIMPLNMPQPPMPQQIPPIRPPPPPPVGMFEPPDVPANVRYVNYVVLNAIDMANLLHMLFKYLSVCRTYTSFKKLGLPRNDIIQ